MIYITGDCHADFTKFDIENFPEQKEMFAFFRLISMNKYIQNILAVS